MESETVHTIWGKEVHSAFEYRIRDGVALPAPMQQWAGIADRIDRLPGIKLTEHKVALDSAFKPAEWDTSWTHGIIDVAVVASTTAAVLDYKTGKRKPTGQMKLYAGYVFAHYPEVQKVETGLVWLKERKIDRAIIERSDMPVIWGDFVRRASRLQSAFERDSWPERPSGLCRGWCPVKSCKFNEPKQQ